MTYQEAEEIIEEMDKAFKAGIVKIIIILILGVIICPFLFSTLEKIWEDFQYWLDCKKWDKEHKEKNK